MPRFWCSNSLKTMLNINPVWKYFPLKLKTQIVSVREFWVWKLCVELSKNHWCIKYSPEEHKIHCFTLSASMWKHLTVGLVLSRCSKRVGVASISVFSSWSPETFSLGHQAVVVYLVCLAWPVSVMINSKRCVGQFRKSFMERMFWDSPQAPAWPRISLTHSTVCSCHLKMVGFYCYYTTYN